MAFIWLQNNLKMTDYIIANTKEDYNNAVILFKEYVAWLNIDLSFQDFENELNEIQLKYSKPDGCIILCKINNEFIACVAIRKINAHTAELKRMYVHPAFREQGIGKNLLIKAIAFAKETNYSVIRLDTLNYMTPAINLYKKIGFYEIPAYYSNPIKTAVYFEITC